MAYDSHPIVACSDGNSKPAGTVGTSDTANSAGNTNAAGTANAACTVDAVGDVWCQYYKTFYGRKLRLFKIS